jgi:5-formyltetrahydrofolate cyclo-ligase
MTKTGARQLYKEKRLALSQQEMDKRTDLLLIQFQQIPLPFLQTVHSYIAVPEMHEINTSLFIDFLDFKIPELQVAVPKANFATCEMEHFLIEETTILQKNKWGIHEPVNGQQMNEHLFDLIFVPLLAVDKKGHRVGYGKGFYDRFLAKTRQDAIKLGMSFFPPIEQLEDVGEFDLPLDYCITPEAIYEF